MSLPLLEQLDRFPDDSLPPEGEYELRDALFEAINAWAKPRGYAFITRRSTKERSGKRTITFLYDRRCQPPSASSTRKRQTTTRGTGCLFSVLAKESLDTTTWTLRHRAGIQYSKHNHKPSQHPSAHLTHRILSSDDQSTVSNLSNAGVAPKEIRTYLRQNSTTLAP